MVEAVVVVALPVAPEAVHSIGTPPLARRASQSMIFISPSNLLITLATPTRRSTRAGEAMSPTLSSSKSKLPTPMPQLKLLLLRMVPPLGGLPLRVRLPPLGELPLKVRPPLGGLRPRAKLPPKASLARRRKRRRRTTLLLLTNTSQRRRTRIPPSPSSRLLARPTKELVMTSGRVLSL